MSFMYSKVACILNLSYVLDREERKFVKNSFGKVYSTGVHLYTLVFTWSGITVTLIETVLRNVQVFYWKQKFCLCGGKSRMENLTKHHFEAYHCISYPFSHYSAFLIPFMCMHATSLSIMCFLFVISISADIWT